MFQGMDAEIYYRKFLLVAAGMLLVAIIGEGVNGSGGLDIQGGNGYGIF